MSPPGTNLPIWDVRSSVAIGDKRTTYAQCEFFAFCRVGPGNFTPSPSQVAARNAGAPWLEKKSSAPPRRLASCDSLRALAAHSLDTSR